MLSAKTYSNIILTLNIFKTLALKSRYSLFSIVLMVLIQQDKKMKQDIRFGIDERKFHYLQKI